MQPALHFLRGVIEKKLLCIRFVFEMSHFLPRVEGMEMFRSYWFFVSAALSRIGNVRTYGTLTCTSYGVRIVFQGDEPSLPEKKISGKKEKFLPMFFKTILPEKCVLPHLQRGCNRQVSYAYRAYSNVKIYLDDDLRPTSPAGKHIHLAVVVFLSVLRHRDIDKQLRSRLTQFQCQFSFALQFPSKQDASYAIVAKMYRMFQIVPCYDNLNCFTFITKKFTSVC